MTPNAGGVEGLCPRPGSASSATAADEKTSSRHSGRQWDRKEAGKRADAGTSRSLSFSP